MKYKNLAIFGLIFCFVNDQYFNASASVGINDFGSKHSSNRGSGVYDDNDGLSLDISETSSRVGSQKISPKISSVDVSLSRAIKVLPEIPKLPLSKLTGFNFDAKSQTGCVVQQRSINSVDMTDEVVYQQFHQYIARQYQGVYRNENEAESHTKKYLEKWHTLSKLAQDVLIYKALKNIQISSVYKGVIDRRSLSFLSVDEKQSLQQELQDRLQVEESLLGTLGKNRSQYFINALKALKGDVDRAAVS